MSGHVHEALSAWDPDAEDLPDVVAVHLDRCADCRAAFDARFVPTALPADAPGRGRAALRRLRRDRPLVPMAFAAAALAAGLALWLAPWKSPPPTRVQHDAYTDATAAWSDFEAADAGLDGRRARAALEAYLAFAPDGEHAKDATKARERLAAVGTSLADTEVRWIGPAPAAAKDWISILWEVWCHFCLPYLRKLQVLPWPVPVYAWTTESRGATDADVREQMSGLTLPVGVPDEATASTLNTDFWPAAVLVCDRHVAWVGHPTILTSDAVSRRCASP